MAMTLAGSPALGVMRVAEALERAAVDREFLRDVERRGRAHGDHAPQLIRLAVRLNWRRLKADRNRAAPARHAHQLDAVGSSLDERQRIRLGVEADRHRFTIPVATDIALDRPGDEVRCARSRERQRTAAAAGAERRILAADVLECPAAHEVVDALL